MKDDDCNVTDDDVICDGVEREMIGAWRNILQSACDTDDDNEGQNEWNDENNERVSAEAITILGAGQNRVIRYLPL